MEEEPGSVCVCKSTFYNRPSFLLVDAGYFRAADLLRNLFVKRTDVKIRVRILFEYCA